MMQEATLAMRFFDGGWAGAVKDRDDDDQSDGVGSSKLGRFTVFGDKAERVSGGDGNGSAGSLVSIKLELDFHCREAMVCRKEEDKLSMKKSSIGGKQYLAYLWELNELPVYIISGLAFSVSLRYDGLSMVRTQGIYIISGLAYSVSLRYDGLSMEELRGSTGAKLAHATASLDFCTRRAYAHARC
jgi:hypothetical protein